MGQQQPPSAPNPAQSYGQGIATYIRYLPRLLRMEQQARAQYDPQRIQEQQDLQAQYGPTQYDQQLAALKQLDPASVALRQQLGDSISADLAQGTHLTPQMEEQLNSQIRAGQAARGTVLGDAPVSAEALFKGNAAQNLYQQRLQNAGNFLSGPTPEQQLLAIQPISPDRSSAYVNPSAGYQGQQFGLQNYQNQLAQYQLTGGGRSPWAGALGGAASGALAGSSFGPYGAVIGGIGGGALGYFSDKRLKTDVVKLYKDHRGITHSSFRYKGDPSGQHYAGVMAQEVRDKRPDAVGQSNGYLTVSPEFAPVPV